MPTVAELQAQLEAQKQLNGASTLGGVTFEQAQFGAAPYNQPVFVSPVA